mmetsp:Transcript_81435/g.226838  ORF Transcript_81435/g.226838 Transcript_81435/m.226838 type:complete len:336 (-) Transcript_81435:458-1465(-)
MFLTFLECSVRRRSASSFARRSASAWTRSIRASTAASSFASRSAIAAPKTRLISSIFAMRSATAWRPLLSAAAMACCDSTHIRFSSSSLSRFLFAASTNAASISSFAILALRTCSSALFLRSSSALAFSASIQFWTSCCSFRFFAFSRCFRLSMAAVISSFAFFMKSILLRSFSASASSVLLFSSTCASMSSRSLRLSASSCSRNSRISSIWPSKRSRNFSNVSCLPPWRWNPSSSCLNFSESKATMRSQWSIGFSFGRNGTGYLGLTTTRLTSLAVSSSADVRMTPYGSGRLDTFVGSRTAIGATGVGGFTSNGAKRPGPDALRVMEPEPGAFE